jgi:outer membrane protein
MKKCILVLLACYCPIFSPAQITPGKTGYIDINYILTRLSEVKTAEAELSSLQQQYTKQLEAKAQVLQARQQEYIASEKTLTEPMRRIAQQEILLLDNNLQKFKEDAVASLQQKKTLLMKPVLTKIHQAVEDVSRKENFSMVLMQSENVLYGDSSLDITLPVLVTLGVALSDTEKQQYGQPRNNLYSWLGIHEHLLPVRQ